MTDADESNAARRKRYTEMNGGSESRVLIDGNRYYFPTGAVADYCSEFGYGLMLPPPDDKRQLWRNKLIYREEKLRRARNAFNDLKRSYERRVSTNLSERNTPPPPANEKEATAKLKELRKEVRHWQTELDKAREKYAEAKPKRLIEREEAAAQNQEKNRSFSDAITKISI